MLNQMVVRGLYGGRRFAVVVYAVLAVALRSISIKHHSYSYISLTVQETWKRRDTWWLASSSPPSYSRYGWHQEHLLYGN